MFFHNSSKIKIRLEVIDTVFSSHTQFTKNNSIKNKTPLSWGQNGLGNFRVEMMKVILIIVSRRSFNGDTLNNRGWGNYLPFLVFEHIVTTHHFNPTQYYRKYQDRKVIQDKVWELHNKGWGYTKIHHYLVDNNYEVGKSRTVVDSMIKNMKKRLLQMQR